MTRFFAAAWKIIKSWLPAAGVKKIKFLTKSNLAEYIPEDQQLVIWGGNILIQLQTYKARFHYGGIQIVFLIGVDSLNINFSHIYNKTGKDAWEYEFVEENFSAYNVATTSNGTTDSPYILSLIHI